MGRVSDSQLASVIAELAVVHVERTVPLHDVLVRVRELLRFDALALLSITERATGWALERVELVGFPNPTRTRRVIGELLATSRDPVPWIDLRRPHALQRNVVADPIALVGRDVFQRSDLYVRVLVPLGLDHHHVARVLLCADDGTLLGWLGGFSLGDVSEASRRGLEAMIPSLRWRLQTERMLGTGARMRAALTVTLEQIGAPAMLVDRGGHIFEANEAARALLAGKRDEVSQSLAALFAKQRPTMPFTLTAIAGDTQFLAVLRPRSPEARLALAVALASQRWKLTRRQTDVLRLIVRGDSNAAIAEALGISHRAAELHITALFDRARVANRAALVAAVLLV